MGLHTYDSANRLKEVKKNSTALGTYFYDANGIRAKKVEGGQTTHYLALVHKNLYEKTGTVASRHIFAGSQRIAEVKDGVVTYYHNDHLGSPRAVTNTSGTLIASTGTRPFGQPHSTNNPTDYLFTGKELDDTGLYYFAARYYDPSVGRFVTEDTWLGKPEEPWTQNRYVYVGNNPFRYVDPSGNMPWDARRLIYQYQDAITQSADKYGVDPFLVAAVIYNENRVRFFVHEWKDTLGMGFAMLSTSDVSVGIGQMTVSTALIMDLGPGPARDGKDFDRQKFAVLKGTDPALRESYITKLSDPHVNIDYVAKYLSYLQGTGYFDTPEQVLDAYNNNNWFAPPSNYGNRYAEIVRMCIRMGIGFARPEEI